MSAYSRDCKIAFVQTSPCTSPAKLYARDIRVNRLHRNIDAGREILFPVCVLMTRGRDRRIDNRKDKQRVLPRVRRGIGVCAKDNVIKRYTESDACFRGLWFTMRSILALHVVGTLLLPALGKRTDIPLPENRSWISDEDFGILVKLSFPFSLCCNVFFNGW